eukprot:1132607-Lingulodinium_polyedra.AAC.1
MSLTVMFAAVATAMGTVMARVIVCAVQALHLVTDKCCFLERRQQPLPIGWQPRSPRDAPLPVVSEVVPSICGD